jgi:wyosine [tRNA(Phe)-imidazoG37] synthetase (radical SAM superfamily)
MIDSNALNLADPSLAIDDHRRDAIGMTYVYPVLSRRAGGVSVGINLNVNNACNWRCVYCQVPQLRRGTAPPVDLALLRAELEAFLRAQAGVARPVDGKEYPRIVDVALAGNGEPTSATEFPAVIAIVREVLHQHGLDQTVTIRVITNGSLIRRASVQRGLENLGAAGGEVWFKLDAGSREARRRINSAALSHDAVICNLRRSAELCPTWVQTCGFGWGDRVPLLDDLPAYVALLKEVGPGRLQGVLLYGIARPSRQPEAPMLRRLDAAELGAFVAPLRKLGLCVRISH